MWYRFTLSCDQWHEAECFVKLVGLIQNGEFLCNSTFFKYSEDFKVLFSLYGLASQNMGLKYIITLRYMGLVI